MSAAAGAAVAGEQSISKSEFARRRGVSPGRVSQYIAAGQIDGDALVRPDGSPATAEDRDAQIVESIACAQLRARLDPIQRLGNGLGTNLTPQVPAPPLPLADDAGADDDDDAGGEDGADQAPATRAAAPASPDAQLDLALKRSRLEQIERTNRKAARDEAEEAGRLTDAVAARAQYGRIAARMVGVFEGSLPQIADAIAARFEVDRRDVLHLLRQTFRDVRAGAAATLRQHVGSVDPTIAIEIGADQEPAPVDAAGDAGQPAAAAHPVGDVAADTTSPAAGEQ